MTAPSVAIIDYGMGNLHSVASALAHVSPESKVDITADPQVIINADRVIFPGVGAIRDCMAEIKRLDFHNLLPKVIETGKPVLAICVGMQAMLEHSEENQGVDCIGVLPGRVRFFGEDLTENGARLKVPHMGWNQVDQKIAHPLWQGIENNSRFYFVHSFYVEEREAEYVAGFTNYGVSFTAAISYQNVFATQFHPEKSDVNGLRLLKNFIAWDGKV